MAGYTRQTTFVDAATIEAADHNNELNQVEIAFNNTTGHAHDGTVAEGPVIGVLGDAGITTPLNKVLVDTASNRLEFWIDVASSSTEQVYIADGVMAPTTDSDVDLGTNTERFKSLYVDDITVTDTEALKTDLGINEVLLDPTVRTSDPTAAVGSYYMCDTSSAGFTVTFPAAPSVGDLIGIMDVTSSFDVNPLTIGRNGNKVFNAAEDGTIDIKGYAGVFVYTGATYGWMPMY